jgi:hypothetical protein
MSERWEFLPEHRDRYVTPRQPGVRRWMSRGDTLLFQTQLKQAPLSPFAQQCPIPLPFNLSGCFVWCTVKRGTQYPDNQAVMQMTSAPSSTPPGGLVSIITPAAGIVQVQGPPIATLGFPDAVQPLVYDIQVQDTSSRIQTLERGTIDVFPDTTLVIPSLPVTPAPPQAAGFQGAVVVTASMSPYNAPINSTLLCRTSTGSILINLAASPPDGAYVIVNDQDDLSSVNPIRFAAQGVSPSGQTNLMQNPAAPGAAPASTGYFSTPGGAGLTLVYVQTLGLWICLGLAGVSRG